ncbi:MAG: hypothetical protein HC932_01010 [Thermales bacterium]|nr:hypothetical protein [Thermales bacterium]
MREISTSLQEKIDIIEYRKEDLEGMIMDSLEPAEIEKVELNEERDHADVFCYPEEASLAVGKRGVNIRLATDLLNVELNIVTLEEEDVTESNFDQEDGGFMSVEGEDTADLRGDQDSEEVVELTEENIKEEVEASVDGTTEVEKTLAEELKDKEVDNEGVEEEKEKPE